MKPTTAAALAALSAIAVCASATTVSAVPNTAWRHQPAQDFTTPAQYGRWDGDRPYWRRGRPRVVCRIVQERVFDPRIGRSRIIEREVCRPRGPRW